MKARALWLGASALAFAWGGSAAAQTAPRSTPATAPQDDSQAAADNSNLPGDIVITAQRRSEDLMTTAVSASVLSGTDLGNKGVANVDALQFAMPSVVVNNFGQGNDFNIRGIGKAEHNTQTTTGVITYRDGVPTFPGYFQMEPYFDVANIQVLRGPQGTIVGQNSTAISTPITAITTTPACRARSTCRSATPSLRGSPCSPSVATASSTSTARAALPTPMTVARWAISPAA
jgi:iron complex outermembrane receptor protein